MKFLSLVEPDFDEQDNNNVRCMQRAWQQESDCTHE